MLKQRTPWTDSGVANGTEDGAPIGVRNRREPPDRNSHQACLVTGFSGIRPESTACHSTSHGLRVVEPEHVLNQHPQQTGLFIIKLI